MKNGSCKNYFNTAAAIVKNSGKYTLSIYLSTSEWLLQKRWLIGRPDVMDDDDLLLWVRWPINSRQP